jgi:hypothetical protein
LWRNVCHTHYKQGAVPVKMTSIYIPEHINIEKINMKNFFNSMVFITAGVVALGTVSHAIDLVARVLLMPGQ